MIFQSRDNFGIPQVGIFHLSIGVWRFVYVAAMLGKYLGPTRIVTMAISTKTFSIIIDRKKQGLSVSDKRHAKLCKLKLFLKHLCDCQSRIHNFRVRRMSLTKIEFSSQYNKYTQTWILYFHMIFAYWCDVLQVRFFLFLSFFPPGFEKIMSKTSCSFYSS